MAFWRERVRWETVSGDPVRLGELTLVPLARVLAVRLPWGGFVWHRPVAVRLERGGRVERLPIHDVTRSVQIVLAVASLMFLAAARAAANRHEERVP